MLSSPFPSSSDGTAPNRGVASSNQLALDNLIRRELKVGDPNDPQQIAKALLERYAGDPRARAITQEADGLPFLQTSSAAPVAVSQPTATSIDLEQAISDVNLDLQSITTDNLLKDIAPELQGWSQSIRSAISEGVSAARVGLDARERDKALAIRRQLGDYARIARMVGALTPALNYNFRNLAQSIDEMSAVLLVMMGEALANVGFAGGRFLLQAPASELRTRRDAAVYALRNLVGATQDAYGPNDWPRGLDAYRRLFDALEAQGQGDLRALLVENELARTMDELVRRAANGSAEGLRALGSTAQIDLQRFTRLVRLGLRLVVPESPPLSAFLQSLQLFVDAFEPAGGFRLLRIARPAILFYGLYGIGESVADQRLTQLMIQRGLLANQLDCLMRCDCDQATVLSQIVLDKLLYDVDRAIDLYCVGAIDLGQPEARAAAYSYVIDAAFAAQFVPAAIAPINATLNTIRDLLRPPAGGAPGFWTTPFAVFDNRRINNLPPEAGNVGVRDLMHNEICVQFSLDAQWQRMVETMTTNCIPINQIFGDNGCLTTVVRIAMNRVDNLADNAAIDCGRAEPDIPPHYETSLGALAFNQGPNGQGRW